MRPKVILVPHTHWDREWYFTSATSNVLLYRLANDITSYKLPKFVLDGQSSLYEKMLTFGDETSVKLQRMVHDKSLTVGPLYVQQDVFNTLIATTQKNIEIGGLITKNKFVPKTMYMPDTFGFNEQIPQVFVKNGFKNFVFWRGIKPSDIPNSNLFYLQGIDESVLLSSCMTKGYFFLAPNYPRPHLEEKEIRVKKEKFSLDVLSAANELRNKSRQSVYFLPVGVDQSPLQILLPKIVSSLNKQQSRFSFVLGTYEEYFNQLGFLNKKKLPVVNYPLYYSGTSKIHRTIHSNRYDIKKLFRECELLTYYVMEPLEIFYASWGGKKFTEKFKNSQIFKPLLKGSAHDALGGCCSDKTNLQNISRLERARSTIKTYVDLMLSDLNNGILPLKDKVFGRYVVYNVMPYERDVVVSDIISTRTLDQIVCTTKSAEIIDYHQEDLGIRNDIPIVNHNVKIFVKKMPPQSYRVITFAKKKGVVSKVSESSVVWVDDELINLKINKKIKKFSFFVEEDSGDEYDYSRPSKPKILSRQSHRVTKTFSGSKTQLVMVESILEYGNQKTKVNLAFYVTPNFVNTEIELNNNLNNCRLALRFKGKTLTLSRHLAFVKQNKEKITLWQKKGYKDQPFNFFANDGLVKIGDLNVFTAGNNQVFFGNNFIEVVLARFVNRLGKPNLKSRPGVASGLQMLFFTKDALLQKKLSFNLRFSCENSVWGLNHWYFQGFGKQVKPTNKVVKNLDNFLVNHALLKKPKKVFKSDLNLHHVLLGAYRSGKNNNREYIVANPLGTPNGNFKKYEIKYKGIVKKNEIFST